MKTAPKYAISRSIKPRLALVLIKRVRCMLLKLKYADSCVHNFTNYESKLQTSPTDLQTAIFNL